MTARNDVERCWTVKARNGRYWVVNRYGRITTRTLSLADAVALLRYIGTPTEVAQ